MWRNPLRRFGSFLLLLSGAFFANTARAEAVKSPAEILPPSTLAYIEINQPKDVVAFLIDSDLSKKVQESENYQKALQTPKYKEFQTAVGLIEARVGTNWRDALTNATGGGLVFAFDAPTQGIAILARPSDPAKTDAIRDALFSLAREDAKNKGNPDPIEPIDYRDFKAFKAGEGIIANIGPYLLVSNKTELARNIADRFLDGGDSLASDHAFSEAHAAAKNKATAWQFVRLDPLRAGAGDNPIFDPKYRSDNPAVEFLVGGLLPIARKAPYVTGSLILHQDDVRLAITAPGDPIGDTPESKFYFGKKGDGAARPLRPEGTMASVTTFRDLSMLWQSGPDLFNEAIATQMAQAESGLSTFFGGKSFATDVLGAFAPQMQIVAVRQDYHAAGVPEPKIKLPGFALIFRVQSDKFAAVRKQLRVGFQSAIALGNLDGTSKGRPTFEMQSEKRGGCDIQFTSYDLTDKATAKDDTYLNFTPALVTSDKYMMLCSTRQIAEQLADVAEKEDGKPMIADNFLIEVDGSAIAKLIHDDREQLIAQNMLEKGHDRATAEKEIDLFELLVGYFDKAKLRLTPAEHSVTLEVEAKLSPGK